MKNASWVALLGVAVIAAGCGKVDNPVAPTGSTPPSGVRALVASGAQLDSAILELWIRTASSELVVVHPAEQPWQESSVTWNNMDPWVSSDVVGLFAAFAPGSMRMNVSSLVGDWLSDARPNYGILLDQDPPFVDRTQFDSREMGATGPRLTLYFTSADSGLVWNLSAVGDAYIDENHPQVNSGSDDALYSGYQAGQAGEERTLIYFDLGAPVAYAAIGDRVWNDVDGNGIQDAGEPGLEGVTVTLYDCFDTPVQSRVTDADGHYFFDSLGSGAYQLGVVAPPNFVFSPRGMGSDSLLDSDIDPTSGRSDCFAAVEASVDLQWDAGLSLVVAAETGCTHGLGYWKARCGFGKQTDEVSALLPIWLGTPGGAKSIAVTTGDEAHNVLGQLVYGHPSNGITKLYARLLVVRLNIASGAAAVDIQPVLDEIDQFLAQTDWHDWEDLDQQTRKQITAWRTELNEYNGGEIGPGTCDEAGDE